MDFTSAYLFGSANGTDFLRDVEYRNHWFKVYSSFKFQLPEERASGEIEKWCLSLCEAAKAFDGSRKSPEGISTKPVVYGRLSQCLEESNLGTRPKHLAIASEMLDHLVAGHETSGIIITYIMHEMSRQPSLQSKLREELLTVSPPLTYPKSSSVDLHGKANDPNSLVSARSIDALPLLDAIVQETLRLYSPAPGPLRRLTPFSSTPTTIDGYDNIPGGVLVSSSAYTLHRNAGAFPEPERWLPERWLDTQKGKREEMKRWFWAFGNGGRMCIGSNLALQQIKLATAAIYTNYNSYIEDDEGIEQIDEFISPPKSNRLILRLEHV